MGISIKNIFLTELNFKRKPTYPEHIDYEYEIEVGTNYEEKKNTAQVILKLSVNEKMQNSIQIDCCMVGVFDITESKKLPLSIEEFLQINAPAIIYPYIREIISNTVLKAGLEPIHIPIYNFKAMYDANKNKTNEGRTD